MGLGEVWLDLQPHLECNVCCKLRPMRRVNSTYVECLVCNNEQRGVLPDTPAKVEGVGPDTPMITNAHGGRQSGSPYRSDLLQPHALLHLAKIMKYGADKYGENNWHNIPVCEHLNHAITHILAYLAGDTTDDHLGHATWRMVSALDQQDSGREAKLKGEAAKLPLLNIDPAKLYSADELARMKAGAK